MVIDCCQQAGPPHAAGSVARGVYFYVRLWTWRCSRLDSDPRNPGVAALLCLCLSDAVAVHSRPDLAQQIKYKVFDFTALILR